VTARSPTVVVTGGGGGIGAAIAEALGRAGAFVVTADPLVSLDGASRLAAPEQTTADRIVAAGGQARASDVSVTDAPALEDLFNGLAAERGSLDAVINVAGISRPTGWGRGAEDDWRDVIEVHLGGYLNVLAAALPLMARAGRGRVVGVTSGSGWRAADAGAYSRAKRAVAALTWQLGLAAPLGVTVTALSPIAATRMVTAALSRAGEGGSDGGRPGGGGEGWRAGGLSLSAMPRPEEIGPIGAHLALGEVGWAQGQILFAAGSELALIDPPRLIEVLPAPAAAGLERLDRLLDALAPAALAEAERAQVATGGSNARFTGILADPPRALHDSGRACVLVTDQPAMGAKLAAALGRRGVACRAVDPRRGFAAARDALAAERADAVVVALAGGAPSEPGRDWSGILADHRGLCSAILADAAWAQAVAARAVAPGGSTAAGRSGGGGRALRMVTLTDALTSGGRSRAQSAAQAARVAAGSTGGAVQAFSLGLEGSASGAPDAAAALVAHLVTHPEAGALAGAELAVGGGWIGLRSHPRAIGSVTCGEPGWPGWLDQVLSEMAGGTGPA
jgi:NAD(P)-dependent dehydrogenase (short-subunit alcohol dehydrogenase family)